MSMYASHHPLNKRNAISATDQPRLERTIKTLKEELIYENPDLIQCDVSIGKKNDKILTGDPKRLSTIEAVQRIPSELIIHGESW